MRPPSRKAARAGPPARRRARLRPAVAMLGGLLAASSIGAGGVYKWVDEHGKVHYGDRPPAAAAATEVEIEDGQAPTATDTERRDKTRRLLDAIESERKQEQQAADRERARSAQRERNCAISKRRVEILQRANSVSVTGDDGKRKYLDDQARAAALVRAKQLVREWC